MELREFRCKFCHRLLAKIGEAKLVEVKCPKCKTMNTWQDEVIVVIEVPEASLQKKIMNEKVRYEILNN